MSTPNTSLLDTSLLEPVLLRRASRRAHSLSDSARARMRPWVEAARARQAVALELRDSDSRPVALGLLREAAFFALCALEAAQSAVLTLPTSPKLAWERFEQHPASTEAPNALSVTRAAFATDDWLAIDSLSSTELAQLRPAAEESVAWLLALAEIRTPERLAVRRRARLLALSLGLIAVGCALISYCVALAALAHPGH